MLGNLKGWVGNRVRVGITGASGVPGENDNERRLVDFYTKRNCVCVIHTLIKRVCISTQDWLEAKTGCR